MAARRPLTVAQRWAELGLTAKKSPPSPAASSPAGAAELGDVLSDPILAQLRSAVESMVLALAALVARSQAAPAAVIRTDAWISASEAARLVRCHPRTIVRAIQSGRLAGHRVGRRYYTTQAALARWVQATGDHREERGA